MGITSCIAIKEEFTSLEEAFKNSTYFKVCQDIEGLLLLKLEKFKHQLDLEAYLGVGILP
ncbi:hypothetical protein [Polaribacter sp. Q13]|uniref:hypothetical protein n=1 Tax=Polaribacter sp. Q13 TaxID=2806551 RepID=UPI00193B37E5|nr:hypothetical protein [Polaribacter sp. Q13]QVY65940.1 hypothetical protein JOP69_01205 [Polaribacter sp. Q13]